MQKIPTLFDANGAVTEGCEWVLAGEGIATRQLSGVGVLVQDGALYVRHKCRLAADELVQPDWLPAEREPDAQGVQRFWVPCPAPSSMPNDARRAVAEHILAQPNSQYRALLQAFEDLGNANDASDGTYEVIGPDVAGDEPSDEHVMLRHTSLVLELPERSAKSIAAFMTAHPQIKGIVFHHPDGRRAKIGRSMADAWARFFASEPAAQAGYAAGFGPAKS